MSLKSFSRMGLAIVFSVLVTIANSQSPTISGFSPSSGSVGTLVTLSGTNLNNPTNFTIGGATAIVISNTGTQLVGMVMPGSTTGNLSVNTASGNTSSIGNFTVTATKYPSVQQGDKLLNNTSPYTDEGWSTAISADGNTAIVGAPSQNTSHSEGCAIIYIRRGTSWIQQGNILTGSGVLFHHMGFSVAINADGNTAVVTGNNSNNGNVIAWVFTRYNDIWTQQGDYLDFFDKRPPFGESSVVISADGNTIILGEAPNLTNPSILEWIVFTRSGVVWTQESKLSINFLPNENGYDFWTMVLSADGNTVVIGHSGFTIEPVRIFVRNGNNWQQQASLLPISSTVIIGHSLAISADGNTLIIGDAFNFHGSDSSMGSVFVYTRNNGIWSQQGDKLSGDDKNSWIFGGGLSLSADGNTALILGVKQSDRSHIYETVFTREGGTWISHGDKFKFFTENENFNIYLKTISLSADGTTAILGQPHETPGFGGEYILVVDSLTESGNNNSGNVGGGGSGGLESKSLGDALAKQVYSKALKSQNGPDDYNKMPKIEKRTIQNYALGTTPSSVKLSSIMPDISSSVYQTYNSTPLDLISITNAKEVLAYDFTTNKEVKAVAFATKTFGELYDHTKPICDRLKGATLVAVENFKIQGLDFVKYTIDNGNGQREYATSFSVGTKSNRNDFSFQSTWLTQDYLSDENMYNFQLWAGTSALVNEMVTDILNKVKAIAPITSIKPTSIPATYIESGKHEGQNVNLVVKNATLNTSGYFKLEDKSNETSASKIIRTMPFTINANGKSNVIIPMEDKYESTLTMYVNGVVKDVVYMSDGTWTVDYNKSTTVLNSFNVTNDNKRSYNSDEYPLFRNVELKANTSDFVSIVRGIKAGGAVADLSVYKGLKLTASGGYNLHITLVKNSIINWKDQYATDIKLNMGEQEYYIALDKFISASSKNAIDPKDITTVVFSVEVGSGRNSSISTTLSNISFSKEYQSILNSLETKEIQLFPNPAIGGKFNCSFISVKAAELTLNVSDLAGKVILSKQVHAVKGQNSVQISLSNITNGLNIISLEGVDFKYSSKKMMITN